MVLAMVRTPKRQHPPAPRRRGALRFVRQASGGGRSRVPPAARFISHVSSSAESSRYRVYKVDYTGGQVVVDRERREAEDKVTVLFAEDDEDVADLVSHVLESEGYHVELARDGAEALARFQSCAPDLVVLDVMMPRLTGFEVLARLRELEGEKKAVPVLMLSARASQEDIVKGFELGVSDYVTKPFMIGELRARIRSLLARA